MLKRVRSLAAAVFVISASCATEPAVDTKSPGGIEDDDHGGAGAGEDFGDGGTEKEEGDGSGSDGSGSDGSGGDGSGSDGSGSDGSGSDGSGGTELPPPTCDHDHDGACDENDCDHDNDGDCDNDDGGGGHHEGACTLTQGYWKNHPEAWPVASLTLGTRTYSKAQLLAILDSETSGNGLLILAHQLIAAKLNLATGAPSSSIASAIADADALIGNLIVGVDSLASSSTSALATQLDRFNNSKLVDEECD